MHIRKARIALGFFLTVLLVSAPLASQTNDASVTSAEEADIFGAGTFDAAVNTGKIASDIAALSWLAGLTLVADNQTTLLQNSLNYADMGTFSGKAFLKATQPDISTLFVSYSFYHTFLQATNDLALKTVWDSSPITPGLYAPLFALSELHLSFDVAKIVFFRVGNQLVSWGSSFYWSPADFINLVPTDSLASVDTRAGKPGLRVHVPFNNGNVFLFSDFSRCIDASGNTNDLASTVSFAFRADRTFLGFNTGLLGAFGPSLPTRAGLATSGKLFGLDVWLEAASILPLYSYDFAIATSAGGEKTFGINNEWNIRGEFFYNSAGTDDALLLPLAIPVSSYEVGKYHAYLSGSRLKLLGGNSTLNLSGIVNCTDLSYKASATFGLHLPKLLPLNISVSYNGGPSQREFTLVNGGSSATFGVQSILQF